MDTTTIKEQLEEIFQDIFDDENLAISDNTTADDIDRWDSLNHINLIGAVERHFKVRFALGELQSMKNVGEMIRLIQKKAG